MASQGVGHRSWVFDNYNHDYATVHFVTWTFCKDGRGLHERGTASAARSWLGPFSSRDEAFAAAASTRRSTVGGCKVCFR